MATGKSWIILRKSLSPRKNFQSIEKEKRSFLLFELIFFANHLTGRW